MKIGVGTAAGATVLAVLSGAGVSALQSSEMPAIAAGISQNQCDVHVRFVVDHAGNESESISGQCAGHSPTVADLVRLGVMPAYLETVQATKAQERRLHVHGPCVITSFRHHPGSVITCRNGQHRVAS